MYTCSAAGHSQQTPNIFIPTNRISDQQTVLHDDDQTWKLNPLFFYTHLYIDNLTKRASSNQQSVQSAHASQTNWTLRVKRAWGRYGSPRVSSSPDNFMTTPVFLASGFRPLGRREENPGIYYNFCQSKLDYKNIL